jgi:predicted enzyme related to lactoylglutathione lyase
MDSVVHFEIPAANVERARKFYKNVFQWKITPVPEMNYTMLNTAPTGKNMRSKVAGTINGGMMKRSARVSAPVIYMDVKDIDASMAKIKRSGGKIVMPKQKVPGVGFTAYVKDTENNVIGLWQASRS